VITSKSNYRVEIRLYPEGSGKTKHEQAQRAWLEIAEDLVDSLGFEPNRIGLAWDASHKCENCDGELELVGDEGQCVHCDRLMCWSCNCGEGEPDQVVCETCWDEGKR